MSPIARQILLESLLAPFVISALILVVARPLRLGRGAIGAGIVAGLLVGHVGAYGWSGLVPAGAASKLPALAVAGLLAGSALDRLGRATASARLAAALYAALVVGWLAWPRLGEPVFLASAGLLWLVGALALDATRAAVPSPVRPLAIMIAVALGLAGIALFAPAVSIMQLALGLTGALAAPALLARLARGGVLPASAFLPAAGGLLGLATILVLFSAAPLAALALVALVAAASPLSAVLARRLGWRAWLTFALLCLLLPALAVLLARLLGRPPAGF